ncbi:MAG: TRAP transporter substrate-binding protein DctP [Planctomycetes bacterium]|nr:TRAP transporter substrate-binding protein DctP [Planctomycetota bacterium]
MRKMFLSAVCVLVAASAAWSLEMKLAHPYEPTHPYHIGSEWAAQEIEKATEGRVRIRVYPAAALGSENEIMEQILMGGDLDIANVGSGQLANAWPPISICVMPYVFRDNDHFLKFAQSPTWERMRAAFHRDTGAHIMGSATWGQKHIIGNRAVRSPKDFQGFRLRVAEQAVLVKYAQAMGASIITTAFSEAYMAIQQNVADGTETSFTAMETMKFYEVAKVISMTYHINANNHFLVKDESYKAMSEQDRTAFRRILEEAGFRIHKMIDDNDNGLEPFFIQQGLTIVKDVDLEACAAATMPMIREYEASWQKEFGDLYTEIRNIK